MQVRLLPPFRKTGRNQGGAFRRVLSAPTKGERIVKPERKIQIASHLIEEFYRNGKMVVYVDHRVTEETFEGAKQRHIELLADDILNDINVI